MTRRRWLGVATAAALVAAAVAVPLALTRNSGPRSGGPLACPECFRTGLSFPVNVETPFTYGLRNFQNRGDDRAVLERVRPLAISRGMRVVGAMIVRRVDNPWNSTADDHTHFPPRNIATVVKPLAGYRLPRARNNDDFVELILGLEVSHPGRFVFRGIELTYRVGDTRYRERYPDEVAVCAPIKAHRQGCPPP
jgi:hypothetical protein